MKPIFEIKIMLRIICSFICLFTVTSVMSQPPSNRTVYDCNANSKNIYTTLATGKSVIVAHKGVDCSICRSAAPGWQTWAAANSTNVEVWGAISYTYSSSAANFTNNSCLLTNNWKATYSWNDIFTFPDSNRLWVQASSPRYYVYSAVDSSIVYQGPNSSIARSMALAQSTVGIQKKILQDAKIFVTNELLNLENVPQNIEKISIYNTNGQLVLNQFITRGYEQINISGFKKGVYIVRFSSDNGNFESRKLVF